MVTICLSKKIYNAKDIKSQFETTLECLDGRIYLIIKINFKCFADLGKNIFSVMFSHLTPS